MAEPLKASLEGLLTRIRACRQCQAHFSHEARPVIMAEARAKLLIIDVTA